MAEPALLDLLKRLQTGGASLEETIRLISRSGWRFAGDARLDLFRKERTGMHEAVYGEGKSPEQLYRICRSFIEEERDLLVTKLSPEKITALKLKFPQMHFSIRARLAWKIFSDRKNISRKAPVAFISAGSADLPVLLEAVLTAKFLGAPVKFYSDCGVAALHRLSAAVESLKSAVCIVVIAGMEGALASVTAGLCDKPVIAVPTSAGTGEILRGIPALLGMLSSCSPSVSVVGIDNGFAAACSAAAIRRQVMAVL